MSKSVKSVIFVSMLIFTLMVNMVFPLPVLADGSPTEEPTVTEEVISSQGETPLGEEPVNSTPIPTENTPEVIPTEIVSESTAAPEEPTATEEVIPTEIVSEPTAAPEEPTATEEVIPTEIVSEPAAAPKEPAEDVTEVVQAMNDAGVILADGDGNPIPLASQTAADALSAPDPMGCPPGVQPVSWGGTGIGCTISYASIQAAIDDASVIAGWTIYIDPGTFDENVTVNKSVTLQGSGAGVTIIRPGASSTLDLGCGAGSCASNTNTILYITADNVTILDLTVDGDNTLINSGTVVNGADLNARNGIYGNAVDNLTIEDTTVQNIYLRGIQASNSNNFVINNNTIGNVDGSSASIAIFNWSSSGSITNNQVTQVNDGIAANYSQGMQVLNNTVSDMNTGIHTDNSGGADVIDGNAIWSGRANSYGIFVFAPYEPISVTNNSIFDVAVGLTLAGNGWGDSLNTVTFSDNQVGVSAGGIGAYVTTDVWGYFSSDVSAVFNDNIISGGDYGFYLESNGAGEYYSSYDCSGTGGDCILNVSGTGNSITGQSLYAAAIAQGSPNWYNSNPAYFGIYNVDLRGNWWGDPSGPLDTNSAADNCDTAVNLSNPSGLGGNVSDCIQYDNWLTADPFFTPIPPTPTPPTPTPPTPTPPTPTPSTPTPAVGSGFSDFVRCDNPQAHYTFNRMDLTFIGLCGYKIVVNPIKESQAKFSMLGDQAILHGVEILLFKDGERIDTLPANAQIIVSYPSKIGIPQRWDESVASWVALPGVLVKKNIEVSTQPGITILTSQP